jgi:hypothetical protein
VSSPEGELVKLRGRILRELFAGGRLYRQVDSPTYEMRRALSHWHIPREVVQGLMADHLVELVEEKHGVVEFRLAEAGRLCAAAAYGQSRA